MTDLFENYGREKPIDIRSMKRELMIFGYAIIIFGVLQIVNIAFLIIPILLQMALLIWGIISLCIGILVLILRKRIAFLMISKFFLIGGYLYTGLGIIFLSSFPGLILIIIFIPSFIVFASIQFLSSKEAKEKFTKYSIVEE